MKAPLVEASEQWATSPDSGNKTTSDPTSPLDGEVSRRDFLKSTGMAGLITALMSPSSPGEAAPTDSTKDRFLGPDNIPLTLTVNGKQHTLRVESRTTLAEALRESLGYTGTKVVCDRGACGGCTVHVNGRPVCSCMMLALDAAGTNVTTVEGLAQGKQLDPLQQAFIDCDALQCGYCTPGMLMSGKALLQRNPNPTLQEVKEAVSGNLCRCGAYPHIFQAILRAAPAQGKKG